VRHGGQRANIEARIGFKPGNAGAWLVEGKKLTVSKSWALKGGLEILLCPCTKRMDGPPLPSRWQ